jgi:hypothetical protein
MVFPLGSLRACREMVNYRLAPPHDVHPQLVYKRKGNQSTEDELQEVLVSSVSYWHSLWVTVKKNGDVVQC